ncbi:MAG TPA: hypothetical protein EYP65_05505 [Armatimonadetes bacterium]|nr:hypothetical protein [Armatimonadota bacterium]
MAKEGLRVRPSREEFLRLAERYKTIPVWAEWSADLDTPVRAFASLFSEADSAFLLESAEQDLRAGGSPSAGGSLRPSTSSRTERRGWSTPTGA